MSDAPQEISLFDSLSGEWLKMPQAVMQDVGPATQTLAGFLRFTKKESYVPMSDIATKARLPVATVRKHLVTLHNGGWINHKGRQPTRRGWLRRTCTIALTKQAKDHLGPYGFLPWWACCSIRKVGRLPWCARAVLSVVMARLASLKGAIDRQDGTGLDADDLIGSIDNMGGNERFRFSLKWLTEQTGLTRESVVIAKRLLNHHCGIVRWVGSSITPGVATTTDYLVPNWDFRVIVTQASQGGCYLAFDRGSENGQ